MGFTRTKSSADDDTGQLRPRTLLMLGVPFVAVVLFMVTTRAADPQDVGIRAARQLWVDSGTIGYEMTYTYRGLGPATVVWDGTAVVEYRTGDPRLEDATIYWVDTLFAEIESTIAATNGYVESVEFHPRLGYPVRARLDPVRTEAGDEWEFEVSVLRELSSD